MSFVNLKLCIKYVREAYNYLFAPVPKDKLEREAFYIKRAMRTVEHQIYEMEFTLDSTCCYWCSGGRAYRELKEKLERQENMLRLVERKIAMRSKAR
jgi:hypothetical protein